jgi:hypothetical protein
LTVLKERAQTPLNTAMILHGSDAEMGKMSTAAGQNVERIMGEKPRFCKNMVMIRRLLTTLVRPPAILPRILLAALATAPIPAIADLAVQNSFALTPAVWSAGFAGSISRHQGRLLSSAIELDYEFFLPEKLETLGYFSFAAQIGRWSFLADSLYIDQSSSVNSDLLSLQSAKQPNLMIEGSVGYQIPRYENIELIAGGRFYAFNEAQSLSTRGSAESSEAWTDPFVGARIKYDFSDRWYASLQADIGALKSRMDDQYNVAAFVGYRLNEITTLELGYRQRASESHTPAHDPSMQSLGVGLDIRF